MTEYLIGVYHAQLIWSLPGSTGTVHFFTDETDEWVRAAWAMPGTNDFYRGYMEVVSDY